jgi:hypothetical protein
VIPLRCLQRAPFVAQVLFCGFQCRILPKSSGTPGNNDAAGSGVIVTLDQTQEKPKVIYEHESVLELIA